MRLIVEVRKNQDFEDFSKEMIERVEACLESIEEVKTAMFDPQVMKIYVKYVEFGNKKDDDDDESDIDIDRMAFLRAVNRTKILQFVNIIK